jgi:hypothetical protein
MIDAGRADTALWSEVQGQMQSMSTGPQRGVCAQWGYTTSRSTRPAPADLTHMRTYLEQYFKPSSTQRNKQDATLTHTA